MRLRLWLAAAAIVGLANCRAQLPTFSAMTAAESAQILAARAKAVRTVEGPCTIVLRSTAGDDVVLDGALVARNPGWLRLRAWKFNRAVFDLILTPNGLWIFEDTETDTSRASSRISVENIASAWSVITARFFSTQPESLGYDAHGYLVFRDFADNDGLRTLCYVDARTLTPRRYEVQSKAGPLRYEVAMDLYRMQNGVPWPHRLLLKNNAGTIEIRMYDVLLNEVLSPNAFALPHNSVKMP